MPFTTEVLLAEIEAAHGFSAAQNVRTYFKHLPSTVKRSGDVGRTVGIEADSTYRNGMLSWAEGLMDGLQTFLLIQGHTPLVALKVREYLWTYWSDLGQLAIS